MKKVAALCVAPKSFYHAVIDVDAYDKNRDAYSYRGDLPIIAHPPCRAWSAFCSHQAKPEEGEKELGLWCARQLRRLGGVLEQPAHSGLFDAAELPKPGEIDGHLWTMEVWQCWFGYPTKKATWLCFSHIEAVPDIPFRLHNKGYDRRRMQVMSKQQRSETVPAFAEWLLKCARSANPPAAQ